jgi:hypothetical protein
MKMHPSIINKIETFSSSNQDMILYFFTFDCHIIFLTATSFIHKKVLDTSVRVTFIS